MTSVKPPLFLYWGVRKYFRLFLKYFFGIFSMRTDATSGNAWKNVFFRARITQGISLATKFTICSCCELSYTVSFTLVVTWRQAMWPGFQQIDVGSQDRRLRSFILFVKVNRHVLPKCLSESEYMYSTSWSCGSQHAAITFFGLGHIFVLQVMTVCRLG